MLKPYLEAKRDQSFPDPSKFKNEDEFLYAAKVTSVFTKTVAEILLWIEEKEQAIAFYEAKKEGKENNKFDIGG